MVKLTIILMIKMMIIIGTNCLTPYLPYKTYFNLPNICLNNVTIEMKYFLMLEYKKCQMDNLNKYFLLVDNYV